MRRFGLLILSIVVHTPVAAQQRLTVQRIFGGAEFSGADLEVPHWMRDGRSVLEVRVDPQAGSALVKVDLVTGGTTVLADGPALTTSDGRRLAVEKATLSADESKVLLFHSSVRVWRTNTRGAYHVYDFATRRLTPLVAEPSPPAPDAQPHPSFLARGLASGAADPNLQMFAKFSPNGTQVAYVRGNNLWVTDLTTGRATALTRDGSDDIINGTTDWVYEEELGLRDAFRFSPDGSRIAYWRFDQSAVPAFPIVDEMSLYPAVSVLRYPKAGERNARVRLGVVNVTGGTPTRWLEAGPDTGSYLPSMEWVDRDSLFIMRLPRRQNRADLLMLSATSGLGRTMEIDRDSAYVGSGFTDVKGEGVRWLRGGQEFLWESDRSGWRQVYLFRRDGTLIRQVTTDGADVLDVLTADEARDMLYVTMAAPNATQRQVFRYSLHGGKKAQTGGVRLLGASGSHQLDIGPTGQWAIDIHSTMGQPATMTL
ncbi:MAG: DPP IV N-terminal domain-containing protein, partial [Gemmatimonadaceae bacterium]